MYRKCLKPLFDFILAFSALMLIWPFLLLIAICIKLDSRGPVFFRQLRGGRNGSYFKMFKFRSMLPDDVAEKKGFEPGSSSRITRVGRILRKTKLDEIPQLLDVFRGKMSLVGPRPEVRPYIELYPERWAKVLVTRPGITDPASIKFRNEEELLEAAADPEQEYRELILPRKLEIYEEYVDNISLCGDVKILVSTIFVVLFG